MERIHALIVAEVVKAERPGLKRDQLAPRITGYGSSAVKVALLQCFELGWVSDLTGRLEATSTGLAMLRKHAEASGITPAEPSSGGLVTDAPAPAETQTSTGRGRYGKRRR